MKKIPRRTNETSNTGPSKLKYFLLFFIVMAYFFVSLYLEPFIIKEVHCEIEGESCPQEVEEELGSLQRKMLFSHHVELHAISTANAHLLLIEDITRSFPHTIRISYRREKLLLQLSCNNSLVSVSTTGHVFEVSRDESTRLLAAEEGYCQDIKERSVFSSGDLALLRGVVLTLKGEESDFSSVLLHQDNQVSITEAENKKVLMTQEDFPQQYQKYIVLSTAEAMPDEWTELDLRFDKPILRGGEERASTTSAQPVIEN